LLLSTKPTPLLKLSEAAPLLVEMLEVQIIRKAAGAGGGGGGGGEAAVMETLLL
jgi:hypothetical protein